MVISKKKVFTSNLFPYFSPKIIVISKKKKKRSSLQIHFVFPTFRLNFIMIFKKHIQQNETICCIFEGGEATASFASPSIHHVGSVVEWLKHRTDDQHGLGSKPTCAILLCPWERHFTALSPAWWS